MKRVLCCVYGDSEENKGIALIDENDEVSILKLKGKCNFCIEHENMLYVPLQADKLLMMEFAYEGGTYVLKGTYETRYFYSHGMFYDGKLILASFSDGVDAIYDVNKHQEIDYYVHEREGYEGRGRSHYVGVTPDKKYIYAVENAFQQIYMYKLIDEKLELVGIKEFEEENIRLMSYSSYAKRYYLNTEKSNKIYILSYKNGEFVIEDEVQMQCSDHCFSGANGLSRDGKHLCVSLRGDDVFNYYEVKQDGRLNLLKRVACNAMPRDVLFDEGRMYLSCTNGNVIEVYDVLEDTLNKVKEIHVVQPVTFGVL